MKTKYFRVGGFLLVVGLLLLGLMTIFFYRRSFLPEEDGIRKVRINELEMLAKRGGNSEEDAAQLARFLDDWRTLEEKKTRERSESFLLLGAFSALTILCVGVFFIFSIYKRVLSPFHELEAYAAELARGNFELTLPVDRANYFGAFTWAFDSMRKEIVAARAKEQENIEKNKLIISGLSHDIKTPLASIRAYSEALSMHLDDGDDKKRKYYLDVILRKCDEVSKLSDDLLLHAISELDELRIVPQTLRLDEFLRELIADRGAVTDIISRTPSDRLPDLTVEADPERLSQIAENLISNALKYGKPPIEVDLRRDGDDAVLVFSDQGDGIPPEDIPFITNKFYRGRNSTREAGSGLGLYIVDHLMERMGGRLRIANSSEGLTLNLRFPLANRETS